jgi:hypothetical protein
MLIPMIALVFYLLSDGAKLGHPDAMAQFPKYLGRLTAVRPHGPVFAFEQEESLAWN